MVNRVMNGSNWAASLAQSEIRILAALISLILSAELSQASSFLLERLGVLALISVLTLTRHLVVRLVALILTGAFSDEFPSFDSELLAELQARMLSFESFHHLHCVLHKFILPLFIKFLMFLALSLALNIELDLSLPL